MKFAVIGGDKRQNCLAELLQRDGHWVKTAGIGGKPEIPIKEQLAGALEDAAYVVLPLPASAGGERLNTPQETETVSLRELVRQLRPEQRILAGRVDDTLRKLVTEGGFRMADYFTREELTVRNAAITAEGAVEVLLEKLPVTLQGTRVLIIGFGRIGKLLAMKLQGLGAEVTVTARRWEDMAWAQALGLRCMDTRELTGRLWGFRAVVNTVPAQVLDKERLRELDMGSLCVELASEPGGFDQEAARGLGLNTVKALGLPGKTASESAGEAIRDAVYHIISEWECEE